MELWEAIYGRELILFGTGATASRYTKILKSIGIEVSKYTDNNQKKWNTQFFDKDIINPSTLDKTKQVVLIVSMYQHEIAQQLILTDFIEHEDFMYCQNLFKFDDSYLYIVNGNDIPKIKKIEPIEKYAIESNKADFMLTNLIENQEMKDLVAPNLLQNKQYPSFVFPHQAKPSGPVYIANLKNGYTYDHNGAIFDENGTMLYEFSTYNTLNINIWDAQRIKKYDFDTIEPKPILVKLEGNVGIVTSIWGADNFYHWMFEELPRFYLLQKSGFSIDRYVSHYEMTAFQIATLNKLGIDTRKIICSSKNYIVQADNLVIPYAPAYDSGYISTWLCEFIKSMYIDEIDKNDKNSPERIYIARGKANHKRVINEEEIIKLLKKYDFKICYMEDYTLSEQASLFYHAKIIIAAHGAGLSHLVYCQPGTKLLEIFNPVYVPTMFWTICSQVGVDYYCSIGKRTEWEYSEEITEKINVKDIDINMNEIQKFLEEVLDKESD